MVGWSFVLVILMGFTQQISLEFKAAFPGCTLRNRRQIRCQGKRRKWLIYGGGSRLAGASRAARASRFPCAM